MNSRPVIVVTGTLREAAVIKTGDNADGGVHIIAGGGDGERLQRELEQAAPYACGIISFGMCGGIDPAMAVGDWIIGKRLLGPFHARCDGPWVAALEGLFPQAHVGAIYADGQLMTEKGDAALRGWSSAALGVDMESHIAGEVAASHDLPFAILRCVSDSAGADLPPAVEVMMRPDGGLAVGAVLKSIVGQPSQLRQFIRTVSGFAKAYRNLGAGAKLAGPRFGFDLR